MLLVFFKVFVSFRHDLLIDKLWINFNYSLLITTQLPLMTSYLSNKQQTINVNEKLSVYANVTSGIPQGSGTVTVPTIYMNNLPSIRSR